MLFRKAFWALAVVVCLAAPVAVQAQGDYLDVFIVKVKPEKMADFQALNKKFVEANRRYNGDRWIALEALYGEGNVYQFTSTRQNYADVDTGNEAFMAAANKAFGKEAGMKMMQDFNSCLVWSRSELRRRRWDLSRKAPKDAEGYAKLIGESRILRITAVHIRPGHVDDFEALLKDMKQASEKNPDTHPTLVSQVVEGSKGTTFYIATLRTSMAGFDQSLTLRDLLGEEGYKKFQQISADAVEIAESTMYRFNPEFSNPPEEVARVASDFWHPKTIVASAGKPKPKSSVEPAAEKEPVKKP